MANNIENLRLQLNRQQSNNAQDLPPAYNEAEGNLPPPPAYNQAIGNESVEVKRQGDQVQVNAAQGAAMQNNVARPSEVKEVKQEVNQQQHKQQQEFKKDFEQARQINNADALRNGNAQRVQGNAQGAQGNAQNLDLKDNLEATVIGSGRRIKAGEKYTHKGDLALDFVPNKSKITVINGNLTVLGHVGQEAYIKVVAPKKAEQAEETPPTNINIGYVKATGQNAQAVGFMNSGGNKKLKGKQTIKIGSIESESADGRGAAIGVINDGAAPENQDIQIGKLKGSKGTFTAGVINMGDANKEDEEDIFDEKVLANPSNGDVKIEGDVHAEATIECAGSLKCLNVADNCTLNAGNAITVQDTGTSTMLQLTGCGTIEARKLGKDQHIKVQDASSQSKIRAAAITDTLDTFLQKISMQNGRVNVNGSLVKIFTKSERKPRVLFQYAGGMNQNVQNDDTFVNVGANQNNVSINFGI